MTGPVAQPGPAGGRIGTKKDRFELLTDPLAGVSMTAALSCSGHDADLVFKPFPSGKPKRIDVAADDDLLSKDTQSDSDSPVASSWVTDVSFQCLAGEDGADSGAGCQDGGSGARRPSGPWRGFRERGGAAGGRAANGKDVSFDVYLPNLASKGDEEMGTPAAPPAFPASFCGPSLGVADVEEQLSVEESLKQHAMAKLTPRFTLSDIAQNPELAKAAKLELAGQRKSDGTENLSSCDAQSRVTEMEHVRFATDTADRDAERELQAGMEQVDVLLKRLEAGRRSVEQMLKFVQKLYQANVAYSRAMMNAARAAVSSMGTSADWKCASDGISELPMVVGGAHSQISQVLVECTAKLQGSLKASRLLSDELTSTSAKIQSDIAASRSALAKALVLHERAAHAFGMSLDQGISRSHDKQKDPWLTEGRLAAGHSELLEAQHSYRAFLADAFKRVRDAEAYRLVMIKSSMATVLRSHGPTYEEQVSPFVSELTRVVGEVSAEGEVEDLEEGANMHEDSALALGTQRKEEKTLMCGDLFSSPDIIRQGDLEMQAAGDSKWSKGHFVLTQSGFLYGFIGEARSGPVPTFSMALMRCSFEEGEAPVFSITDGGLGWMRGRGRTIRLKAPSVNECCEWAIVMRETIAILQGRL